MKRFLSLVAICSFMFSVNVKADALPAIVSYLLSDSDTQPKPTITTQRVYKLKKTGQKVPRFVGDDGDVQAGVDPSYTRYDNHDVVVDNITALMWQDNEDVADKIYRLDERTDEENATKYCNNLVLAGYDDWRLPSVYELETIVDYGRKEVWGSSTEQGAIDPIFKYLGQREHGGGNSSKLFLTSSRKYSYGKIWTIQFGAGQQASSVAGISGGFFAYGHTALLSTGNIYIKNFSFRARCVRGEEFKYDKPIVNLADQSTGLIWQEAFREPLTEVDKKYFKEKYEELHLVNNQEDAIDYCQTLGTGWRLPNIRELTSIADKLSTRQANNGKHISIRQGFKINTTYTSVSGSVQQRHVLGVDEALWSSTMHLFNVPAGWVLGFGVGNILLDYTNTPRRVRCVKTNY